MDKLPCQITKINGLNIGRFGNIIHSELTSLHHISLPNYEGEYLWTVPQGYMYLFCNYEKVSSCSIICITRCVAIIHVISYSYLAKALITRIGSWYKVYSSNLLKGCTEPIASMESSNLRICIKHSFYMSLYSLIVTLLLQTWWGSFTAVPFFRLNLLLSVTLSFIIGTRKIKIFQ